MKVIILGAGTCAMSVADILAQERNFKLAGFVGTQEEERRLMNQKIYGEVPFVGDYSILSKLKQDGITGFVAAMRSNSHREKAYYQAVRVGLTPINVISPRAVLEPSVCLGKGVAIHAGCIISHKVKIDNNVIVEIGSLIGINTTVSDNCFISQGSIVGGKCHLGRNVFLGIGAMVLPYIDIGKNQTIEAGTAVEKKLEDLDREKFDL